VSAAGRPGTLVAGVGNIFLGDDGFGPAAAESLAGQPLPEGVRVVDYGIRGMHLAYDLLDGYDRLILIDALPRGGQPGDVVVLEVGPEDVRSAGIADGEFDAHGMAPAAMLGSLAAMGGELPPTVVVGCEPLDVEEGMGLSPPVEAAVGTAVDAVLRLLDTPANTPTGSEREVSS
jgi:hydrogenase maturation protease